ncbi:hypothetical protein Tco_0643472 [Tanacetum coccineum]
MLAATEALIAVVVVALPSSPPPSPLTPLSSPLPQIPSPLPQIPSPLLPLPSPPLPLQAPSPPLLFDVSLYSVPGQMEFHGMDTPYLLDGYIIFKSSLFFFVDQSIVYGVSFDVDTAYSLKSGNDLLIRQSLGHVV